MQRYLTDLICFGGVDPQSLYLELNLPREEFCKPMLPPNFMEVYAERLQSFPEEELNRIYLNRLGELPNFELAGFTLSSRIQNLSDRVIDVRKQLKMLRKVRYWEESWFGIFLKQFGHELTLPDTVRHSSRNDLRRKLPVCENQSEILDLLMILRFQTFPLKYVVIWWRYCNLHQQMTIARGMYEYSSEISIEHPAILKVDYLTSDRILPTMVELTINPEEHLLRDLQVDRDWLEAQDQCWFAF